MTRGTYKHKSCLDIQLHVTEIREVTKDYIKVVALYYNPNFGTLAWPTPEVVTIKTKDLWKWNKV